MRKPTPRVMCASFVACIVVVTLGSIFAIANDDGTNDKSDRKVTKIAAAQKLIAEAAYHEIYGRNDLRDQLLDQALKLDPSNETAQAQRGRVKIGEKWFDPTQENLADADSPGYREYLAVRDANPDTVEGNLAVANWCRQNHVPDRERAHLERVTWLDPNHSEARRRLGFQRIQNRWVSQTEREQQNTVAQVTAERMDAWSTVVAKLGRRLANVRDEERARELIRAIDHPAAIAALEQLLGSKNEATAQLVVDHIAIFPQVEATDSLIRFAVFGPWESVRKSAAQALGSREMYQYVPTMLAEVSSPIISRSQIITGARGGVLHQLTFFRDVQGERQVLEFNSIYNRATPADELSPDVIDQGQRRVASVERQASAAQAAQNQAIDQLNDRIMTALRTATGEPIDNDPQAWWKWWNDRNGVYTSGELPLNMVRNVSEVELVDRSYIALDRRPSGIATPAPTRYECLVAGTPVWTDRGPVAVEQVRVGDLVLSQDVASGRLEYKPVVRPTVRPATPVVHLDLDNGDRISASGGHPFWVAGEGWFKAGEIKPGMSLHALDGSVLVRTTTAGPAQELYNLVIADNQDYFVGKSAVLSHDNSLRAPTPNPIPGVAK